MSRNFSSHGLGVRALSNSRVECTVVWEGPRPFHRIRFLPRVDGWFGHWRCCWPVCCHFARRVLSIRCISHFELLDLAREVVTSFVDTLAVAWHRDPHVLDILLTSSIFLVRYCSHVIWWGKGSLDHLCALQRGVCSNSTGILSLTLWKDGSSRRHFIPLRWWYSGQKFSIRSNDQVFSGSACSVVWLGRGGDDCSCYSCSTAVHRTFSYLCRRVVHEARSWILLWSLATKSLGTIRSWWNGFRFKVRFSSLLSLCNWHRNFIGWELPALNRDWLLVRVGTFAADRRVWPSLESGSVTLPTVLVEATNWILLFCWLQRS